MLETRHGRFHASAPTIALPKVLAGIRKATLSSAEIVKRVPRGAGPLTLIVAGSCFTFFTNLGAAHLWDEDEGFFAGCAAEMFARQDWVVPYFNGQLFSHKPPFMYWIMMLGFESFGVTPFAARLGSAIFGVATALVTYGLGKRLFCAEVGLLAALITCSSLMFEVVARAATPDSYLVFFMMVSLYLFTFRVSKADEKSTASGAFHQTSSLRARWFPDWKTSAAMYAMMGLAVLVKGPIGALLPMAAIGLYLLCTTPREELRADAAANWHRHWLRSLRPFGPINFLKCLWAMRPLTAATTIILVAGPWFLYVGLRTHGQFPAEFFGVHNFGRFLRPMESHHGSLLYYPIAILIGFFPWSVFAGPTVIDLIRRIRSRDAWSDSCVLLVCWIGVIVVFFSLAGTKLPNYVLPAYPPLALLTACFFHRWMHSPETVAQWQPRACFGILGFIGAALLIGLPLAGKLELRGQPLLAGLGGAPNLVSELPVLGTLGILPLAGAAVALWFAERARRRASFNTTVITAALLGTAILGFAAVRIDRHQYTHKLAETIANISCGQPARVGQYRHSRPTLVFYLRQPVEQIHQAKRLPDFFAGTENAFLITTAQNLPDLKANLPADVIVLAKQPQFPQSGTILVLGRTPQISGRSTNLAR